MKDNRQISAVLLIQVLLSQLYQITAQCILIIVHTVLFLYHSLFLFCAVFFKQRQGSKQCCLLYTSNALIVGGGTLGYYLATLLSELKIDVRIVEAKRSRCEELSQLLPETTIICGDGTDKKLLMEEGLTQTEAFVTLTNMDEENILLSLFAKKNSSAKLITKVTRIAFDDIVEELDLRCV